MMLHGIWCRPPVWMVTHRKGKHLLTSRVTADQLLAVRQGEKERSGRNGCERSVVLRCFDFQHCGVDLLEKENSPKRYRSRLSVMVTFL